MRIGINTLFLIPGKVGGTETYLRGLIHGLSKIDSENEYILFTNQENHTTFEITGRNFQKILCQMPARLKWFRVFWEQIILPKYMKKNGIAVLHSPGYVSPVNVACATVVTIPDMQYWYYPQNFPKVRLWYWQYFIPWSARKADMIVTLSNNSKQDIVNLLQMPEQKVVVTYPAAKVFDSKVNNESAKISLLEKYGIQQQFILSVASLLPHKNLDRLIEGFSLLTGRIDHQLILVGLKSHGAHILQEIISQKNISLNRVKVLGYIPDDDLIVLYQHAALFILPSLFEGFGIPLLEAMTFGCPVAASSRTAIPEVVGNAGILFNPDDPLAIAETIYKIVSDNQLREGLIQKGYERAKTFSWEQMAHNTLIAYRVAYEQAVERKE